MSFFPRIDRWVIPELALSESFREMARDGMQGNEGIVLWLGRRCGDRAEITHLVALRGHGVVKRPELLRIFSALVNDVTDLAIEQGVTLVGHIHSHGTGYGTNLSPTDRKYGIAVPYFLSVVAPHYALKSGTHIGQCGIHVFEPGVGFRRLPAVEARRRVEVIPGPDVPLLIAGKE